MKINLKIIGVTMVSLLILSLPLLASDDTIDPAIPESWYEAPQLASEWGINEFNQSPMLDERVEKGELASVKERLPEDPPVIEPYETVGKYGGTANTWRLAKTQFYSSEANYTFLGTTHAGTPTPDGTKVVPKMLKGWSFSEDKKSITFTLRKGLKWSDGYPFTTDDFVFWWDHVANNKDLHPVPPEKWAPPIVDLEKIDKYTFVIHYGTTVPIRDKQFHNFDKGMVTPAHYFKQYHPDFRDKEELLKEAKEAGFDNWYQYYEYRDNYFDPGRNKPTLKAYIPVEKTPNYILFERNPYYPFVDTEGNQLPYIDKVRSNVAQNQDMLTSKIVTGETTIGEFELKTTNIPLYMKNEDDGNYNTYIYRSIRGSELGTQLNLTHKDPQMRKLFQDVRFRRALSYATNREEINDRVYFGKAVPRQATALSQSNYFEPGFDTAYAEFRPDKAKELLDEIGLTDVDGDGYREFPSGEKFNPTYIYANIEGAKTDILELLISQWEDIGLNIDLRQVSYQLVVNRRQANDFDISCWHVDWVIDLSLPFGPYFFAPVIWPGFTAWPEWVYWYQSGGEEGEEPPAEVKQIIEYADTMRYSLDKEERIQAGKNLLRSQAENLWAIGTVGMSPRPVVAKKNLKNIPTAGLLGDGLQNLAPYYPMQYYLEQ